MKHWGPEGCRGAPDMVVEILSGNTAIEMERKFELYRVAGVREYWVIDPEHKTLYTYRFQGGQILPQSYNGSSSAPVSIFPDLTIALEPVVAGSGYSEDTRTASVPSAPLVESSRFPSLIFQR
ncbi:MAG: Uma2 family endonuclease [Treponema sp.]|nr:Uma2 family endonuclease [Treponema sp.]